MAGTIQQIIFLLAALAIFSRTEYCFATAIPNEETLRKYKEESQSLANNFSSSKIASIFDNDLDSPSSSELKNSMPFYQGGNIPHTGIDIEHASEQGAAKRNVGKDASKSQCNANNCELGNIFSSSAMMDREVKMDEAGFKKDAEGNIIDNKGYLDKAKKITKSAATNFDFLKGEYKNCQAPDSYTTTKTVESCDQYYDVIHNNCPVNQVVEIDPRYVYECHKKREVKEKVCNEYVNATCDQKTDCGYDAGGVLLGSIQSGIEFRYSYPTIIFGNTYGKSSGYMSDREMRQSTAFRCRGDYCCAIDSVTANFQIKNLSHVKAFRIKRLNYVQPIMIKLNGDVIYHSFGGYKFQKTGRYATGSQLRSFYAKNPGASIPREWSSLIDTGNGVYSCYPNNLGYLTFTSGSSGRTAAGGEYFRSFDSSDLKYKLREGSNSLEITVPFDNHAFLETEFYLEQYCCSHYNENSEVKCEYVN